MTGGVKGHARVKALLYRCPDAPWYFGARTPHLSKGVALDQRDGYSSLSISKREQRRIRQKISTSTFRSRFIFSAKDRAKLITPV